MGIDVGGGEVLGEDLHLDTNGDIIEESNRTYTWLNEMICEGLSSMRIEEVLPKIKLPLDTSVLHRYSTDPSKQRFSQLSI